MDLCLVADGTYDAYWERRLHAWDVVAGSALVLAAGGPPFIASVSFRLAVRAIDARRPDGK